MHPHAHAQSLSHVRLFVTPWAVAYQPPLCMGFSRSRFTGAGCLFLFEGIILTQGSYLHLQADSLLLTHLGSLLVVFNLY